jgi:hypothetical protein
MMEERVRRKSSMWLLIVLGAVCSAAAYGAQGSSGGDPYLGTWTGTWDGADSGGGFELTLEKGKDGAVAGKVSVTGDPTYKAVFKTLSFDGKKMTAAYDFPPDEGSEVRLSASFDGGTASGTWSLREKANGSEAADGTWTVSRK